jgi:hypothetical protein
VVNEGHVVYVIGLCGSVKKDTDEKTQTRRLPNPLDATRPWLVMSRWS